MELVPDTLLKDRYIIIEQLGKGGMGAVYLGRDTAVDRLVAVKANHATSPEGQRQFELEARLLASLRHPNLPLVTDHFIIDEVQYLVMDYVPGDDLSARIKAEGAMSLKEVMPWVEELGSALSYLHSQDPVVIHRDIKPANLKIMPRGEIILVDFGIAKASESGQTTLGARGYTPGFAPPEQYGDATTGPYSDQYSMAATIYALLTGSSPPESVDLMLDRASYIPARSIVSAIPEYFDDALQRAMAIEPENRYANVAEFTQALKDPGFRPSTAPDRERVASQATEKHTPKKRRPLLALGVAAVLIAAAAGVLCFIRGGFPAGFIPLAQATPTKATLTPVLIPTATITPTAIPPTDTPQPTETLRPTATPIGSGGLIAFVSNRDGTGFFQVFTMNVDGGNVTQLTFDQTNKSQPVWSPDGGKLLYVANGGRGDYNVPLGLDIWQIDANGSNPVNISKTKGDDIDPAWHPDGTRILFVSDRSAGNRQLFLMNADGSDVRFISQGYAVEYNPTYSPDGQWMAFGSSIYDTLNLRVGNGGEPQLFDVQKRLGWVIEPAWSPDGEYIAYVRVDSGGREIWLARFVERGGEITRLTFSSYNTEPAWSPDGQWIVYASSQNQNLDIFTMDRSGRFQVNLTNDPAQDKQPSWQPRPVE